MKARPYNGAWPQRDGHLRESLCSRDSSRGGPLRGSGQWLPLHWLCTAAARLAAAAMLSLALAAPSLITTQPVTPPLTVRPRPRCQPCVALEWPPAGVVVTVLSGMAILARPDSALWGLFEQDPEPTEEERALMEALCRPDGWEIRATIGADLARSLGGTGSLATSGKDGTAALSARVAFEQDARFAAYPQGTAKLLRPSRALTERPGLWSVETAAEAPNRWSYATSPEMLETAGKQMLELRWECEGVALGGGGGPQAAATAAGGGVGGGGARLERGIGGAGGGGGGGAAAEVLVPAGPIYFSAEVALDARATRVAALTSGRVQARLRTPGRSLSLLEARRGPSSPPQAGPRLCFPSTSDRRRRCCASRRGECSSRRDAPGQGRVWGR